MKSLLTPPRNGPDNSFDGMETGLPFNVADELRVMAGYKAGEIQPGRELAVIAKGILHLAALVNRRWS